MVEYCLGDIGLDREMQALLANMSTGWWLPCMQLLPAPTPAHEEALRQTYAILRPDLVKAPWPPESHPMTPSVKRWPALNVNGMVVMYRRLWELVHANARDRPEWQKVVGVTVKPLMAKPSILQVLWQIWRLPKKSGNHVVCYVGNQITEFLEGGSISPTFVASIKHVKLVALGSRRMVGVEALRRVSGGDAR